MSERPTPRPPHQVAVLGEALVDFFPETIGQPLRDVDRFMRAVGGAPANLSIGLARLQTSVRMLTVLGDDEFGRYLHKALAFEGVDTSGVRFTREAPTGMTFVSVAASGERSFMCVRETSAEWMIRPSDFAAESLDDVAVFHLGSNLMPRPSGAATTFDLLERARAAGCVVSMDANLRLHHWPDPHDAMAIVWRALRMVDVLKLSEEELIYFLEGDDDPRALHAALSKAGPKWLVITLGAAGSRVLGPSLDVHAPAPAVEPVDTTGAGDGFCAGLLHALLQHGVDDTSRPPSERLAALNPETWLRVLTLANHVGAQVCTRLGATTALPRAADIPWEALGLMRPGSRP